MNALMRSALLAGLLAAPALASAQDRATIFVAPYVGATSGGGDAAKSSAPTVGVAAGWLGTQWWGFEADLANTNGFFLDDDFRTKRSVMTFMGNALVGVPVMSGNTVMKLYGAAGFGMIRPQLTEAGGLRTIDVKQPGYNVGAGITVMKNKVGLRGDVRYFRAMGDEADDANGFDLKVSSLHFVRVTGGLVVGF